MLKTLSQAPQIDRKSAANKQEAASPSFVFFGIGMFLYCSIDERLRTGKVGIGFAEFQPQHQRTNYRRVGLELRDYRLITGTKVH